jgi:hypothetical protein
MVEFPPQLPHGCFKELFPDVFFLTGQIRIESDPVSEFSRNMVVVREGDGLTLVNSIRLDDAGLAALDALGNVRNIVKLGGFHGRDDAFYLDRYAADLWAPDGMTYSRGEKTDRMLADGQNGPIAASVAFVFDTPKIPEAMLLIELHGGILLTCDSFQNMLGPDKYFNEAATKSKRRLGFFKSAVVGPGWRKFAEPKQSDLKRVLELNFSHLVSAHGEPLLDGAFKAVANSICELAEK